MSITCNAEFLSKKLEYEQCLFNRCSSIHGANGIVWFSDPEEDEVVTIRNTDNAVELIRGSERWDPSSTSARETQTFANLGACVEQLNFRERAAIEKASCVEVNGQLHQPIPADISFFDDHGGDFSDGVQDVPHGHAISLLFSIVASIHKGLTELKDCIHEVKKDVQEIKAALGALPGGVDYALAKESFTALAESEATCHVV